MSCLRAALPVIILAASSVSAIAEAQSLPTGSRVRVWSSDVLPPGRETTVTGARGDTVLFSNPRAKSEIAIARETFSRIDVRVRRGSPALRTVGGVVLGTLGGILVGAALGKISVSNARASNNCPDGDCGFVYLTTLPLGALGGGIAGGLVGHHTAHFWRRLSNPQQVDVVPALK